MGWTEAQKDAIETRGKTVLVSAAAGSGKTTTLTERIIRRLTDESGTADIGRYLIVTFTKASAADLKNKISKALGDALAKKPSSRHLNRQMIELGSAKICTIDSFYSSVVRANFEKLGLPAKLSILDEGDRKIMMGEVMDELLNSYYNNQTSSIDFTGFMDVFMSLRGGDSAVEEMTSLYDKMHRLPEFLGFISDCAERFTKDADKSFFETRHGEFIKEQCLNFFEHANNVFTDVIQTVAADEKAIKAYGPAFAYDKEHFAKTAQAINNGDYMSAVKCFDGYAPVRCGSYRGSDEAIKNCKQMRDALNKKYLKMHETYFQNTTDEIRKLTLKTADFCRTLVKLLTDFDEKFTAAKLSRSCCDFNDNKRNVYKLFIEKDGKPTLLAREYSEQFDAIYIDEFQDTDEVQDMIFSAIAKPDNRFMVGDIKQSIYRFRGTDPEVFLSYKNRYPDTDVDGAKEKSIFMSENFRCDKTVIDFVNAVCGYTFTHGRNTIGYVENDDLVFGKKILPNGRKMTKVKLSVIRSHPENEDKDNEDLDRTGGAELERRYVVSEIVHLLESSDATCEENGVLRRIRPSDIAVLSRNNSTANAYADKLKECGVPCSVRQSIGYFENPEVLLVISLLNVIDNPQKDVYLAGLLRSPLYGFDMDELIEIRHYGEKGMSLYDCVTAAHDNAKDRELQEKITYFLDKLTLYRDYAQSMPVDKLIRFLYADTSIMSFAGLMKKDDDEDDEDISASARRANLLLLYDYARRFENGSFKGLYNFIGYIKDIIDTGQKIVPASVDGESDVVNVMTIHNSKGLEFPVVFLVYCQKQFKNGSKKLVDMENRLGIGAKFCDDTGFAYLRNIIKQAIIEKNAQNDADEEKRLLYVALTRARERLYVSGYVNSDKFQADAMQRKMYNDIYSSECCHSYLEVFLTALPPFGKENELCEFKYILPENNPEPHSLDMGRTSNAETADESETAKIYEQIKNRFAYEYGYTYLSGIPAKMSVSKLFPDVLDDAANDTAKTDEDNIPELLSAPRFLLETKNKYSSAERGTATHAFLQFCDFDKTAESGVKAEIERLARDGFIDSETVPIIDILQLEAFFESDLFEIIKHSRRVLREQRFNVTLPASDFTQNGELKEKLTDETLTVQGVIDLVLEDADGNLILCDYKTDYLTRDELLDESLARNKLQNRHVRQLSYYAAAVKRIFGREPKKIFIYSLPLGRTVDIDVGKVM